MLTHIHKPHNTKFNSVHIIDFEFRNFMKNVVMCLTHFKKMNNFLTFSDQRWIFYKGLDELIQNGKRMLDNFYLREIPRIF